jgi:hypothetical protein
MVSTLFCFLPNDFGWNDTVNLMAEFQVTGGANTNDLQHMLFSILIEPENRCRNPYKIVETCITKVKILSTIEQIR